MYNDKKKKKNCMQNADKLINRNVDANIRNVTDKSKELSDSRVCEEEHGLSPFNTTDVATLVNSYPLTINGNSLKTYTYYGSVSNLLIQSSSIPFSALSTIVNAVIVRCNLIENNVTMPNDILDSFPITSTFGSNINYLPISDNSVKLKSGKFNSIIITFSDQNFNPLLANDSNVMISLLIHFSDKKK
jgi:hypothetical protein